MIFHKSLYKFDSNLSFLWFLEKMILLSSIHEKEGLHFFPRSLDCNTSWGIGDFMHSILSCCPHFPVNPAYYSECNDNCGIIFSNLTIMFDNKQYKSGYFIKVLLVFVLFILFHVFQCVS